MAAFAPDSSAMMAALLDSHVHHDRAVAAFDRHFDAGNQLVIVGHTLLETYSSLTRMPPAHRISPDVAGRAIRDTFLSKGTIVAFRPEDYERLILDFVTAETVGGQVYDAAIVACARLAGVEVILTFNERHFRRFDGDGLSIEVP